MDKIRSASDNMKRKFSDVSGEPMEKSFLTNGQTQKQIKRRFVCKVVLASLIIGALAITLIVLLINYRHDQNNNIDSDDYIVTTDPRTHYITLAPKGDHFTTLIYFPGDLTAAESFSQFGKDKLAPLTTRIIITQAPYVNTDNGGYKYRWFNLTGYPQSIDEYTNNLNDYYNQDSLIQISDQMRTLIYLESQRFADKNTSRVFIGGFSQGSDLALSIFLRSTQQMGGIFALSGMVPLEQANMNQTAEAVKMQSETPIFLYNGLKDDRYIYDIVTESYKYLKNTVYSTNLSNFDAKTQDIGHTWSEQSIQEGKIWLDKYTKGFGSQTQK